MNGWKDSSYNMSGNIINHMWFGFCIDYKSTRANMLSIGTYINGQLYGYFEDYEESETVHYNFSGFYQNSVCIK